MASKNRKGIKTARADPQEAAGTQGGFLRRWSERKVQARSQEKRPASSDSAVRPAQESEPTSPLTDADMPPVDTLDENSDYKGFLSPQVSEELRRLALRKLFHLPKFNIRDGLDDYDEDFRTFEAIGNIVTAHERHQLELRRQEEQERLAQEKAAEKPPLSVSDAEAPKASKKDERAADATPSAEFEDTEGAEEDGEHSRRG